MRLTKLQRYTAYVIMLVEAERRVATGKYKDGLCRLTNILDRNIKCEEDDDIYIEVHLQELNKYLLQLGYCIHGGPDFIFPENKIGWLLRIELLKQCIKETSPD